MTCYMQIKVLLILPRHLAHDQDLPINLEMIEDRVLLYEVGALRYEDSALLCNCDILCEGVFYMIVLIDVKVLFIWLGVFLWWWSRGIPLFLKVLHLKSTKQMHFTGT